MITVLVHVGNRFLTTCKIDAGLRVVAFSLRSPDWDARSRTATAKPGMECVLPVARDRGIARLIFPESEYRVQNGKVMKGDMEVVIP